jgi:hypothetical protein
MLLTIAFKKSSWRDSVPINGKERQSTKPVLVSKIEDFDVWCFIVSLLPMLSYYTV